MWAQGRIETMNEQQANQQLMMMISELQMRDSIR